MKELDPKKLARFEKWCRAHYAPRTVAKYVRDVRTACANGGVPPKSRRKRSRIKDFRLAFDVWDAWGEGGPLPIERPVVPPLPKLGGKRLRDPKRVYEAVSFPKAEYDAIIAAAARRGDLASLVLVVEARTGLRISDVLRAPLGTLRSAMQRQDGIVTLVVKDAKPVVFSMRNGGAVERAWRALLECPAAKAAPPEWHVAAAMMGDPRARAEAQYGAYERVRKTLRVIGKEVGATGRVHLHRFRRSVGVYLAIGGATVDQIQKTFGQTPGSPATREYLDEARAQESARLLRGIE